MLARQHAFGGFVQFEKGAPAGGAGGEGDECEGSCTRHHAIDWNFVGAMRPLPNKWRVRPTPQRVLHGGGGWRGGGGQGAAGAATAAQAGGMVVDDWQELSYAFDDDGEPYYFERWRRYPGGSEASGVPLALRASVTPSEAAHTPPRDAIVVIVGDHFNYVVARPLPWSTLLPYGQTTASVVDAAIESGQREVAEAVVLLEAGHGRISSGWCVDAALQPWRIGQPLSQVFGGEGREPAGSGVVSLADALSAVAEGSEAGRVCLGRQTFEVLLG